MTAQRRGHLQLLLIAAAFIGPLALAAWLYFGGGALQPDGRTNHGELLQPIVNLDDALAPGSKARELFGDSWVLVHADAGPCAEGCRDALYTMRQSRLMLGRDMERLERVLLHGAGGPDTVFLAEEHPGLLTLRDDSLLQLLDNKRPAALPAGGFFLIDPLGNLVMYFAPGLDPADMVEDIERLLRLSRIG